MRQRNIYSVNKRKYFYFIIFFVLLLLQTVFLSNAQSKNIRNDNKLIMGIIRAVGSDSSYIKNYTPFVKYIADELKMDYGLQVLDYADIADALMSNRIDIAIFSPYSYINAQTKYPNIKLFAIPRKHNSLGYHSVIVCKKNKNYNSLGDFRGKAFAFTNSMSTSGYQVPMRTFIDYTNSNGVQQPESEFRFKYSGSHSNSVYWLAQDSVEGIATYEEVFLKLKHLNIIDINDVKFIGKKYFIPNNAYVLYPGLDESLKKRIKSIMYKAHKSHNIDARKMFSSSNNIMAVQQWVEKTDEAYNDLRKLLEVERLRPKLEINIETTDYVNDLLENRHSDLAGDLFIEVNEAIKNTKRFTSNVPYARLMKLDIELSAGKDNVIIFNVFLRKNNLESRYRIENGTIVLDELINNRVQFGKKVTEAILYQLPIYTKVAFDSYNKHFFIPYGSNDGINSKYEIELSNKEIITLNNQDITINAQTISFPMKYKSYFENDKNIIIRRQKKIEVDIDEDLESNSGGFWDKLDNVWGVIGIIVALVTMLVTTLFQQYKQRKFKEKLQLANGLLKEYFEGKEIESKIIDFRAELGFLLEKNQIKEVQYNVLINKLSEISNIIEQKKIIDTDIKEEIECIISDRVITEKEYQHLIGLMKKANEK